MSRELPTGPDRLKITVLDDPTGSGGPTHTQANAYEVRGFDASTNISWAGDAQHSITLLLQNGPLSSGKPANGLTEEALLAIVIDRLRARNDPHSLSAANRCEATLGDLMSRVP